MKTYIIVDDEPLAHDLIEKFCNDLPHLLLKKHCYNALEAMEYLSKHTVDLMFLDLNMPKLKGFDFLRTLSNPPKVIVTTAHKEFALEGFELNVADYLLKPFSFPRFVKAINNAFSETQRSDTKIIQPTSAQKSIFIKGDKKYHQINIDDLLFIEAYGNYTKFFFTDHVLIAHASISFYETELSDYNFLRVHKSFIIALDKIQTLEGNRIFILDHKIPIGQTYKKAVIDLLKP